MLCVSIYGSSVEEVLALAEGAEMVELRCDLSSLTPEQVGEIAAACPCLLVTCRLSGRMPLEAARPRMVAALEHGARYADVEIEAPKDYSDEIAAVAHRNGALFISSFHDYQGAPCLDELYDIYKICQGRGADIAKVVTTAQHISDAVRTLHLYGLVDDPSALVAFSMGEKGKFSRYLSLRRGAPFGYVAHSALSVTAPGQYRQEEMRALFSKEKYPVRLPKLDDSRFGDRSAVFTIPSSKSLAQRAILAAAFSEGETVLDNFQPCNDSLSAIEAVRRLGAVVTADGETLRIRGVDPGQMHCPGAFTTGESGLLTRLLLPFVAYLSGKDGIPVTVEGCGSILGRNLSESEAMLKICGVDVETTDGGYLPFRINGGFSVQDIKVDGSKSSQSVSGLLMTLPLLEKDSVLTVTSPASLPYIRLTMDVLRHFGISVQMEKFNGEALCFHIAGRQRYRSCRLWLEGDWSSASYFFVGRAVSKVCHPDRKFELAGLSDDSLQADRRITEVLAQCGDGPVLRPFSVDATHCPDLFPALVGLACWCKGKSAIKGVGRLYEKESNRAEAIYTEFSVLGASLDIVDDTVYVSGSGGKGLHGGQVSAHNDHRMAMIMTVLSLFIEEDVYIDDMTCINKSFPSFLQRLLKADRWHNICG